MKGGNDNEGREWRSGGGDDDGITINCLCGVELFFMVGEVKTSAADTSAAELAAAAKTAAAVVGRSSTAVRNVALLALSRLLRENAALIVDANLRDMTNATDLSDALKDRLQLSADAVCQLADGVVSIKALDDPVGALSDMLPMPSGIVVGKMRIPLGVILAIYESRPGVTADIAALAIKSGNAVILRGGSEARCTNEAIAKCIGAALFEAGLPDAAVIVVADGKRETVGELLKCADIDLVIPRGGRSLIERVAKDAVMPSLKHLDGNCHLYIDESADLEMALAITMNAKTRRYGVCNALESLLVHSAVAKKALPPIAAQLAKRGVELRGCRQSCAIIGDSCKPASEEDFYAEYLAPVISICVVPSLDAAVVHINHYGSGHTDAICARDYDCGWRFLREVDSASVMINASTAFADGGEYGLGAEVGISTDKLHARGPVGVVGLTTQKYVVFGSGQVRS